MFAVARDERAKALPFQLCVLLGVVGKKRQKGGRGKPAGVPQ
jgi:hypothetical protein